MNFLAQIQANAGINFNKTQLLNARIQNLAVAPSSPVEGQIYHNTADHETYIYNGTSWRSIFTTPILGGSGIDVDFANEEYTISHGDTSNVVNLTASSRTYVTALTFDDFGHVTGFNTSTETVVDTNDYLDGATFNDLDGNLVLSRTGALGDITVNLDGRYLQSFTETDTLDSVTSRGNTTTNSITVQGIETVGNAIIGGDLTVNGTVTTVNTETVNLADNILLLNSNEAGTPSQDAGIEIERGTEINYQFLFDEVNNDFRVGEVGDLQPVLTRDEVGNLEEGDFLIWNSTDSRAVGKTSEELTLTKKYASTIGDGAATTYTVTHNLGTTDVDVTIKEISTGEIVYTDVVISTINSVTINFASAPNLDNYRVIVVG